MLKSVTIPLLIHMMGRMAALLMLYFIFSEQRSLWLFYLPLLVMAACMVALPVYNWRHGRKKEAKQDLITYAVVLAVIVLLRLFL